MSMVLSTLHMAVYRLKRRQECSAIRQIMFMPNCYPWSAAKMVTCAIHCWNLNYPLLPLQPQVSQALSKSLFLQ